MRLTKFAIDILNEVADECEERAISISESEQKRPLFEKTADKITKLVEILVESESA